MIKGGGEPKQGEPGQVGEKSSETDKGCKLWHFWTTSVWCLLCKKRETRRARLHAISQANPTAAPFAA